MALIFVRSWISAFGVPAGRIVRVEDSDSLVAAAIAIGILAPVADPGETVPIYQDTISRAELEAEVARWTAGVRTPAQLAESAELRGALLPLWKASETVAANALRVSPGGAIIQRTSAGTTRSTYDSAEETLWTVRTPGLGDLAASAELKAGLVPLWVAGETVGQGALRLSPVGSIIQRNSAGKTRAEYDSAEAAQWVATTVTPAQLASSAAAVRAAGLNRWQAGEPVPAGALRVTPEGVIIRRIADGVTRGEYDATEVALWTAGSITPAEVTAALATQRGVLFPLWQGAITVPPGVLYLSPQGTVIRRITGGVTRASYDTAEAEQWTPTTISPGQVVDLVTTQVAEKVATATARVAPRVLALGTSITAGSGVTPEQAWPALLPGSLSAALVGSPVITVTTAGVSGDTSDQMKIRLGELLAAAEYDMAIIETSINDTRTDFNISVATAAANMRTMIGLCRVHGVRPIVLTAAPINPDRFLQVTGTNTYSHASVAKASEINIAIRAMTAELRVDLVDLAQGFAGNTADLPDGLHPNANGHAAWALAISGTMAALPLTQLGTITQRVADGFTRANTTATLGTAPTGQTWATTDDWGIVDGQAYSVTPVDGEMAIVNAGVADMAVSVTARPASPGASYTATVIARADTNGGHYLGECFIGAGGTPFGTSGAARVYKRTVTGPYTVIAGPFPITGLVPDASLRVTLAVRGALLTLWVNDKPVHQFIDTTLTSGTRCGFRHAMPNGAGATRYDDFLTTS